jgi:putative tryptophan/tyrosine transport system substrate-binding protein
VAPSLRVEVRPVDPDNPDDINRALDAHAKADSGGGLIVTSSRLARAHRELIVASAARYRLPAIYAFRVYVADGGLMSYGSDALEPYRRAAGYIDRILRGERPAELPVQAPTKTSW